MLMSRQAAPESDDDSLFGDSEGEGAAGEPPAGSLTHARRSIPPNVKIEGLYFDPDVCIPESVALDLLNNIKEKDYFRGGTVNQLMLFERSYDLNSSDGPSQEELAQSGLRGGPAAAASSREPVSDSSSLPPFLVNLLSALSDILRPHIPSSTHDLLFPSASDGQEMRRKPARQAILNLYRPGEGITPHVDLLKRFGDGIIIVSLGSGTVMQLASVAPSSPSASSNKEDSVDLWLEPRSILVLEKDARYQWTHGIPGRKGDWVENDMILSDDDDKAIWMERGVRVSITLRWLLPGAEIVGGVNEDSDMS